MTVMVLGLLGCEKEKPQQNPLEREKEEPLQNLYYFNVVRSGWHVQLTMNSQPVEDTTRHGFIQEVSRFVISGENKVHIVAEAIAERPWECDVRFVIAPIDGKQEDTETLGGLYKADAKKGARLETTFTFQASMPFRWIWQDAEDIGRLTETDRKAILTYIEDLAMDYRKYDWKAIEAKRLNQYSEKVSQETVFGPGVEQCMQSAEDITEIVERYEDYTVAVAPEDKIKFAAGTKVVRVYVDEDGIIYAGHATGYQAPTGQVVYSLGILEMHFVKRGGRWCWF